MQKERINHFAILAPVIVGIAVAGFVLIALVGCGDTITSSVKPDWRSIHQPAPTTPN